MTSLFKYCQSQTLRCLPEGNQGFQVELALLAVLISSEGTSRRETVPA